MITCSFENGNRASLRHTVDDNLLLQDDRILLVKRANQLIEGGTIIFAGSTPLQWRSSS